MGIRELMIAVRKWSGMSQPKLAKASGWDDGNISKFEHGKQGATPESIDSWIEGCGYELIAVPKGAVEPRELQALPAEKRELVLRLARLMLDPPGLTDEQVDTVRGDVERWERQRMASEDPSSATRHDRPARTS
jgi:transcriptional regulator with XRE-family HTH domain